MIFIVGYMNNPKSYWRANIKYGEIVNAIRYDYMCGQTHVIICLFNYHTIDHICPILSDAFGVKASPADFIDETANRICRVHDVVYVNT